MQLLATSNCSGKILVVGHWWIEEARGGNLPVTGYVYYRTY